MGKRTRRYEVEFTACLLACGPVPTAVFESGTARQTYKREIMQWWRDWHAGTDTPTQKSQFKFYRKFRTWQKVYLRRARYEQD